MNNFLKLYLKSTIALARGVRIKSTTTANSINSLLSLKSIQVDLDRPETWRYYLNMAGEYHASNDVMTIVSHDTYEVIEFTKANMQIHLLTARNYSLDSLYFRELLDRYPDQEILIQGIIDPVDINTALNAKDHTILTYPKKFIEGNEQYLIPSLQKYIDNFFGNRHNPDYSLFEPYYYVKLLSGLATKIVLEILRLRQSKCKTDKAHSFHVRQYLLSYSEIGKEFRFLSHSQRMWFYRNIKYINRHIGKDETFQTLVERVMTSRGYSLVGYDLSKNTTGILDNFVPGVEFTQLQINRILPASGAGDKEIRTILAKEAKMAKDNPVLLEDQIEKTTVNAEMSLYGSVPTKVLESNVIDRTDSEPFTISEITLNHWIYLSHFGRYNAVVQINNPVNGERYNLSMKDAFILFLYSYNAALGITLLQVPSLTANRVVREPLPTFNELRKLADKSRVPDYYINHILGTQPVLGTYISIEAFRAFCREVWDVMFRHRELRFFATDYRKEGELHTLVDRCYMDVPINLANEMSYVEWLEGKGIDFTNTSSSDYMILAQSILTSCTGNDLQDSTSMTETHRAMLRIMTALSSYSLQYIAEINDSSIKVIDGKFPTMSDNSYEESLKFLYDLRAPRVMGAKVKHITRRHLDVCLKMIGSHYSDEISQFYVPVNIRLLSETKMKQKMVVENHFPFSRIAPLEDKDITGEITSNNPISIVNSGQYAGDVPEMEGYLMSHDRLINFLNRSQ